MQENSQKDTVNIKKHKSTVFIFFVCINAALSAFFIGYSLVYISTIQNFETIIKIYGIKIGGADVTESVVTGCVPIGSMIGAILSSIMLKKLSRRKSFLFTNFLAVMSLVICFVKIASAIIIGRLLIGICTGLFSTIIPLYINEFTPLKLKNYGTFKIIFTASAQSFAFFFYYFLTEPIKVSDQSAYDWISNFFIVTITIQTFVFIFIFPYETPKYYLSIKKPSKCRQLLGIIYKQEWAQEAYQQLLVTLQNTFIQSQSFEEKQQTIISFNSQYSNLKDKIKMPKIAIFLAIHIALFQQMVGINSVALYGGKIVKQVLPQWSKITPIFTTMLPAISSSFTTHLLKKYGRKTLIQFGGTVLIIPLSLMCICFALEPHFESQVPKILIVVSLFIYQAFYGLTLGPIFCLMVPEFVQPRIVPYSTMASLTGTSICIIIFPIASVQLPNKAYLFSLFLIWDIVSLIINQKFLVQTKDKKRQQIYKQLKMVQDKFRQT